MTFSPNDLTHEKVLEEYVQEIDITPEIREEVVSRYQSLGRWLERPASSLRLFEPYIAPQGSFLLGTAILPESSTQELDVDLICRLMSDKSELSQKDLKAMVGKEISAYAKSQNMINRPKDKRRCWTLKYADKRHFHVDILPCIPDADRYRKRLIEAGHSNIADDSSITEQAIAITDKTHPNFERLSDDWPTSNPLGYAAWFFERMAESLILEKQAMMARGDYYERAEDIPDHKVKTTLQKAVMILKRHKDTMFYNDPEGKPISIIISTLAALAYNNETTITGALSSILNNMDAFIEEIDGIKWIANPVNPEENFADKWQEMPSKERNFYKWLSAARRDFGLYLNANSPAEVPQLMRERLGTTVIDKVLESLSPYVAATPAIISSNANAERASAMAEEVHQRGSQTSPWCATRKK